MGNTMKTINMMMYFRYVTSGCGVDMNLSTYSTNNIGSGAGILIQSYKSICTTQLVKLEFERVMKIYSHTEKYYMNLLFETCEISLM